MLTEFQKRFVAEVLITPNSAADALRRCGYKGKNFGPRVNQLMSNPEIAEALAKSQKRIADKLDITAERVLREIALLGFSNMDDYVDIADGKRSLNTAKASRDQMAAVQEITEDTTGGEGDGERKAVLRTRFKLVSKVDSLKLLGQHLKLFTEVVKHEGLEGVGEATRKLRERRGA